MYRKIQVVFDCADPAVMMDFWGAALGYEQQPPPPGYESWQAYATEQGIPRSQWRGAVVDPTGQGPRLYFQTVPEPKTAKNRVHLDIGATDRPGLPLERQQELIAAKVAELVALGATVVESVVEDGEAFTVLHDPESNEFCVH